MASPALADCGPDALGTSRTLTLPREAAGYGLTQHKALPLQPGEVVLTFDDGPAPATTPQVLKVLKEQCVRATFFMNGVPLLHAPELALRVRAEGHSVGMHGNTHAHAPQESVAEQMADLKAMDAAYRKVLGTAAASYRFPFLEETPEMLAELAARRVTVMSVDLAIDDWVPDQSPQALTERLLARLKQTGGGIILMHDIQQQTTDALPTLLKALKTNGYRVVHLEWQPE
jgi:peptidoglycan/xylan/chitin deacetylase (PgdA/CDA1 family)